MTILDRSRPALRTVPAESEPEVPASRLVGEVGSLALADLEARMQTLSRTIPEPEILRAHPDDAPDDQQA